MSRKLLFYVLLAALSFGVTAVVVLQAFFMASVIPHGGIF
jgi:hypothetical protein